MARRRPRKMMRSCSPVRLALLASRALRRMSSLLATPQGSVAIRAHASSGPIVEDAIAAATTAAGVRIAAVGDQAVARVDASIGVPAVRVMTAAIRADLVRRAVHS
jgi:hypothetical protein